MGSELELIKESILKQLREKEQDFKSGFQSADEAMFRRRIEALFRAVVREQRIQLRAQEQEELLTDVIAFFLGLGPIEKLLNDPAVTEILVNGPRQVYVERKGILALTDIVFRDDEQLMYFVERILSPMGRRVTEYEPYVDARLKDGSRVNVVRAPVSSIGPIVTIRKFSHQVFNADELLRINSITAESVQFLKACVQSRLNILICGGAGAGKTTLLNALASFISPNERVVTIEDTRELKLPIKHVVPMETRPSNIEGKGEISIRALFRNALHMRPDRIIVGEVRSDEVLDMIQAMNTGHEGSMTTLHANAPLEALDRLEILGLMGSSNISCEVARRQIISAVDVIAQMTRSPDGTRRLTQVSEVVKGIEYRLRDLFVFDHIEHVLKPTGEKPSFAQRLERYAGYVCK
jgi:pilus assembly protein CpaF